MFSGDEGSDEDSSCDELCRHKKLDPPLRREKKLRVTVSTKKGKKAAKVKPVVQRQLAIDPDADDTVHIDWSKFESNTVRAERERAGAGEGGSGNGSSSL
jgi:hypothetical protein